MARRGEGGERLRGSECEEIADVQQLALEEEQVD